MNFLIVGPGAMGCLFAASLKRAGFKVTLLDYHQERAAEINARGVRVEGIGGEYVAQVPTVVGEGPPDTDLVLVCVKSPKTMEAARGIEPWIPGGAKVMSLQNGLGNLEILAGIFGEDRVMGGVTAEGATLLGPGHVRHAGQGDTEIGPAGDPRGVVERTVSAFNRAGFRTKSTDRVTELIWGKLIINVGINALTAITGLKNGLIPEIEGTRLIMEDAVREAVAVAKAKGVRLPYPEPLERVKEVCRLTAANIASMLQDVLGRRMTEIDFINGAIVREGKTLNIPTPVNHTLTALVRAIQESYQERVRP
jgi:2-dehydropantoate 2-reductase